MPFIFVQFICTMISLIIYSFLINGSKPDDTTYRDSMSLIDLLATADLHIRFLHHFNISVIFWN